MCVHRNTVVRSVSRDGENVCTGHGDDRPKSSPEDRENPLRTPIRRPGIERDVVSCVNEIVSIGICSGERGLIEFQQPILVLDQGLQLTDRY